MTGQQMAGSLKTSAAKKYCITSALIPSEVIMFSD